MDYESYRRKYFVRPAPKKKAGIIGQQGISVYIKDYQAAQKYYSKVFGAPQYIEGPSVTGWALGEAWFSLFPSKEGNPKNVDFSLLMDSREKVEEIFTEFISAGAKGDPPQESLLYVPVYAAFLKDPFGLDWSIIFRRPIA